MKSLASVALLALFSLPLAAQAARACPDLLNQDFKRLPFGKTENLCQYQDKVILVVNTASRCGFTPQFEGLQKVYDQYKSRGFVVLGFPSNDFNQEPEQGKQITTFCKVNYGVDFPMYEKSSVKGASANPFYKALTKSSGSEPRWNFHKYLITRDGKTVVPMESRVEPDSREVRTKIEAMLDTDH
ncbi:MAG: glutathione peroxidase [Thiobacillaceae bacterium]